MKYDALVYGPMFCDLVFTGLPEMPALGEEHYADDLTIAPGGSAIVAVGLQRLGVHTGLIADLARTRSAASSGDAGRSFAGPQPDPQAALSAAAGDSAYHS